LFVGVHLKRTSINSTILLMHAGLLCLSVWRW